MPDLPPKPESIDLETFKKWRNARRGTSNPSVMTNVFWNWAVASGLTAYDINAEFKGPDSRSDGPCWCFDRYGQSVTELPDGRKVYIAGEHEDHYDPDFYIYNDVVVQQVSGEIEIYGYLSKEFPPTDFHSATLTPKHILLIGSLGYQEDRLRGKTQVMAVELSTWKITSIRTSGDGPGWIHDHEAELIENDSAILLRGGKVEISEELPLVENIDDWRLDLSTFEWSRLTNRPWCQFEVCRKDRQSNQLWELGQSQFEKDAGWLKKPLSAEVEMKLKILPTLFTPAIADEILGEDEQEFRTYRVRVNGVVVRFVDDGYGIQVTIEGELPESSKQALKDDLVSKLSALEGANVECLDIRG